MNNNGGNVGSAAGTAGSVDIYSIPGGTYVGNQATAAPWGSPIASGTVVAAGPGPPSTVTLSGPIVIPGTSTGAHAIVANGLANAYTNGATNPVVFSDPNLTLTAGSASNAPFLAPTFNPRVVSASVNYLVGSMGTLAANTTLGAGCYAEYASCYENFAAGANDLANSCIT